jgi:WD40 repeat protein
VPLTLNLVAADFKEAQKAHVPTFLFRLCHVGVVNSVAWKSDNASTLQFASAGNDHAVRIFNVDFS